MSPHFCQHCARGKYSWHAPGCVHTRDNTRFKVPHRTVDIALKAAWNASRTYSDPVGTSLSVYRCRFGDHYHVGHVKHLPPFSYKSTKGDTCRT